MKIAITGKGGVGKTTFASTLARVLASKGFNVLAVDADPDANLAQSLGIPPEEAAKITPIAEMKALAEERTGAEKGSFGMYFSLTPRVDDIADRFGVRSDGVNLIVLGTIEHAGSGCICPESVLLKSLMRNMLLDREEALIMDMEAGIEHLGRGTADAVDMMIVVVEPGVKSIQTARQIEKLAAEIGIKKTAVVINKVRNDDESDFVRRELTIPVLGVLHENDEIRKAEISGASPFSAAPSYVADIENILVELEKNLKSE